MEKVYGMVSKLFLNPFYSINNEAIPNDGTGRGLQVFLDSFSVAK